MSLDDIKCNYGKMIVEIVASEKKGKGMSQHIIYQIRGYDDLGDIDVMRRYSEFLVFHDMLFNRYPGLFIPPVPPKARDNKTDFFVEERQYYLG